MMMASDAGKVAYMVAFHVGSSLTAVMRLAWRVTQDVLIGLPLLSFWCASIVSIAEPQVLGHLMQEGVPAEFLSHWLVWGSLLIAFIATPFRVGYGRGVAGG